MALGSTQPLTEMSTRLFPGGKGCRCVRLTTLPPSCAVIVKSGNLNFLETSGPLQACNWTALPFIILGPIYNHNWRNISNIYLYIYIYIYIHIYIYLYISKEIFSPSSKLHREVGQAKDLSAPRYIYRGADKSLARPGRKQATATKDFDLHISYL